MADDNTIMSYLQGIGTRNNDCGWGGNGFGLLIILFFLIFGGWGYGRNGMGGATTNLSEFDSLLSGQNQIRNQMGYDTILNGVRGLERGISDSTFSLNNTVTNGFAGVQNSLCQGFNSVNSSISNLGFNLAEKMTTIASQNNLQLQGIQNALQSCCCDLKTAIASGTQAVLDSITKGENQALRDKLFEMSQKEQTTSIVAQLKTTGTTTTA